MPLDSRVVDARVHLVYPGSIPGVASNKIKDLAQGGQGKLISQQ
jgi:hypothetical protein